MDRTDPFDWNDLNFLLKLDLCGGATQAAQHMGVSHQTVTRRLRTLEQALGICLVDKSVQPWKLTVKGQRVCGMAAQMENVAQEIVRFTHSESTEYSGRVGISSVSWALDLIVLPTLKRLQAKHPNLTFDLIPDDMPVDVQTGEVDIALRFTASPPKHLIGRCIAPVSLGVLGIAPLIEKLDQGQTHQVPVVRLDYPNGPHMQWPPKGDVYGPVTTVGDFGSLISAIRHGIGVGVAPIAIGNSCPELRISQTITMDAQRSAWILRNQDSRGSKKIQAVEAEIIKLGRKVFGVRNTKS